VTVAGTAARAAAGALRDGRVAAPAGPSWLTALRIVYVQQFARVRVARVPLLFVAALQSVGILLLLRGVVDDENLAVRSQVVAGSTVLVVAFVALNLLAQRFGALRAAGALDYYAGLPVPSSAIVLGTAASYASFTLPGVVLATVTGAAMFGLSLTAVWVAVPAAAAAAVGLAGIGALLGLGLPRPEFATLAGQLGMTAVLFLGVIPPAHLPAAVAAVRDVVPSTYPVDALAAALRGHATVLGVGWRLAAAVGYGVVALALAGACYRRVSTR
jgi:ABC-2 type transport system permease protein